MVTIKEIADAAGASRGTVDRVIHNRGKVSPDVERAVRAAIETLGYKPNKAGRILAAAKRPRTIGIIMPSSSNRFFIDVERGMRSANKEASGAIELSFKRVEGFSVDENLKALEELERECVDAIILTSPDSPEITDRLSSLSIPFSALNSDLSSSNKMYYVGPDYYKKGEVNAGLLSLAMHGKANILILSGSDRMRGHREIVEGFINALDKRGAAYEIVAELFTEDSDDRAEQLVSKALLEHEEINTVFISTGGVSGALKAIGDRRLCIFSSDDIEEVKDGIRSGRILWTISQEPYRQGYESVKMMQDYFIEGKKPKNLFINQIVKIKENIED